MRTLIFGDDLWRGLRLGLLVLAPALAWLPTGCMRMDVLPMADKELTLPLSEARPQDEMPVSLALDPTRIYRVGPRDVLRLEERQDPTLTNDYPITEEGNILIPNVGPVKVSDLTTKEIETRLNALLTTFIREPDVHVGVKEYNSKVVYVVGQLASPGAKVMRADMMTLQEAIYAAGLPTNSAALSRVQIISPDNQNKPVVYQVDLADILYKGKMHDNILLKPNDTVYVPARYSFNLLQMVRELVDPVSPAYDLKYKIDFSGDNNRSNN
jgi:polysaccharide export outer membrane protein